MTSIEESPDSHRGLGRGFTQMVKCVIANVFASAAWVYNVRFIFGFLIDGVGFCC